MKNRIVIAAMIVSTFEMYDFGIYFILAPVLAGIFFPHTDPIVSLIAVDGVTLSSCLARPLGGIIYGHFGDRIGRKKLLVS